MTQKNFIRVAGGVFLAVALLHGARLIFGWEVMIAGWQVPRWVSGAGLALAGWLSFTAFRSR
ncbi:MAG: hypothetical protein HY211_03710 [Candidatus Omnitrophica bacterium]|nr:hypothetical protein [Candidatus Omnitrophota bacterium]